MAKRLLSSRRARGSGGVVPLDRLVAAGLRKKSRCFLAAVPIGGQNLAPVRELLVRSASSASSDTSRASSSARARSDRRLQALGRLHLGPEGLHAIDLLRMLALELGVGVLPSDRTSVSSEIWPSRAATSASRATRADARREPLLELRADFGEPPVRIGEPLRLMRGVLQLRAHGLAVDFGGTRRDRTVDPAAPALGLGRTGLRDARRAHRGCAHDLRRPRPGAESRREAVFRLEHAAVLCRKRLRDGCRRREPERNDDRAQRLSGGLLLGERDRSAARA